MKREGIWIRDLLCFQYALCNNTNDVKIGLYDPDKCYISSTTHQCVRSQHEDGGIVGVFFLFGDREPFMQPFWLLILYQALCCGCRQTHCVGPESTREIVNVVNAMNEYMQTDTFPNSSKGGLNLQSNDYRRTTGASFREYI